MLQATPAAVARSMPRFAEFVAMMAALMALTALSIDVMLPALPEMRAEFGLADPNLQQLVITSYVLGFAVGQLFHGPLSDGFGRKPVLLVGLAVYALASFACLAAGSFEVLLAARFLQGLANAAPRVVAVAVVRDVYGGRRMAEVMSFVMMVFIIVPVLAPTIGGAFLIFGSWHLIFGFLLRDLAGHPGLDGGAAAGDAAGGGARSAVGGLADRGLPRDGHQPPDAGYTLATGVIFGALMGYINSAQQIFTEVYGAGAWFPVLFGAVAAALALASFVNSRFVGRVGMRRMSHGALIGFVAVACVHVGIDLAAEPPRLAVFVALLALNLLCFGLMMPNFNAIAMEPMGRIAGTASSFVGAVTTGLAAGLGLVVGLSYDGGVTPLLLGFAVFGR